MLIERTSGTREVERDALAALATHLVDGAIVRPEPLRERDLAALPAVLLGEHHVGLPFDHVGIDNTAARAAVGHLVGLGRRRIAAIGAHSRRSTSTHPLQRRVRAADRVAARGARDRRATL
ncbi:LacI family transcriptional regulator [Actinosynnema sp. NPDC047251]|uniref:Uncharacterized protein n=1 Tax=Saccharothrix espanaensis (strain ATCC 51144 / DSM 44229 / JCM 9112 / NBRC 15066 / NRRL 15764) TaxID=1179773 RepID=K0JX94_SACES|nr:LacI family transcriptional regulator [Saccharothrix espanaensis]CCH29987.1 hypothetical protein BN6_26740 [Saccharothrix espanaensis DSM 44229]